MNKKIIKTRRIAQVIFQNAQVLDITGPMEVFAQANEILAFQDNGPAYEILLVADKKGPVSMSSGLKLLADESFETIGNAPYPLDTLLIAGGDGVYQARFQRDLLDFINTQAKIVKRMVSICSGTFLLAKAGLLDGKQATTHWSVCQRLAKEHPEIKVVPDKIFIRDKNIYSSAGVTAGIDLALRLVEEDFGRDLALGIAKQLVVFMKRQGGQSQFSTPLARQHAAKGVLADILAWMKQNPDQDLCVEALARRCAMGDRNFARVFKQEVGMTPGKYVEKMRIEYAAQQIETQNEGLKRVAQISGFRSEEMMRRAFKRQLNVLPHLYRKRFGREKGEHYE